MALPQNNQNDFIRAYRETVELLGTQFDLKDSGTKVTAHFVEMKADDIALANSVGIEAQIAHALNTPPVKKYDVLVSPTGLEYTVHVSHEIFVNNNLVGYKLVIKT